MHIKISTFFGFVAGLFVMALGLYFIISASVPEIPTVYRLAAGFGVGSLAVDLGKLVAIMVESA